MADTTRPIMEAEEATTARARLAGAIGLLLPLSPDDVDDIVALGIEGRDAFEELPEDRCEPGASPSYRYAGGRWAVEFRHGRPHLIEAVNVAAQTVRSAV